MDERSEADPEVEHHPPDEFFRALAALDATSLARLRKVMRVFARPPLAEGQDLLQEVHVRILSGSRAGRSGSIS